MKDSLTHRQTMKLENQRILLSLIHQHPLSRSALAAQTGLTQASVSLIVDDLMQEGILLSTEKAAEDAGLGRKPILLDINESWGFALGLSIDRDGVDIGLVTLKGRVLDAVDRFPADRDYTACLDRIAVEAERLLERNRPLRGRLIALGAAVPGPFDAESGKILNPPGFFEDWYGLNLREELTRRFSCPVFIEHNSVAFAKAELCAGAAGGCSNFLLLNINAGLGAGLVLGGRVYTGNNGYGGEFGHTSIDMHGRPCSCGNRGCLEQYASISAMLYDVQRLRPDIRSWEQLVDSAYDGDPLCVRFLEDEAEYLAHAIVSVSNLLGLEAVIFTGKIRYRSALLLDRVRDKIQRTTLTQNYRPVTIAPSSIQDHPHVVSGAAVVIDRVFHQALFYHETRRRLCGEEEPGRENGS